MKNYQAVLFHLLKNVPLYIYIWILYIYKIHVLLLLLIILLVLFFLKTLKIVRCEGNDPVIFLRLHRVLFPQPTSSAGPTAWWLTTLTGRSTNLGHQTSLVSDTGWPRATSTSQGKTTRRIQCIMSVIKSRVSKDHKTCFAAVWSGG